MYVWLPLILSVDFSWLLQVPFPFGRLHNQETIIFRYFCIENLETKILFFSKSNWDPVIHLEVIQWLWKAWNAIFSIEVPGQSMKLTWKDPAPWNIASFNHFEVKFDLHQETTNPKHSILIDLMRSLYAQCMVCLTQHKPPLYHRDDTHKWSSIILKYVHTLYMFTDRHS